MNSIFKTLNSTKKTLYPAEVVPMLTTLFKIIKVEFDVTKSIKTQLGWRKKKEYELILKHLQHAIETKDVNKLDWSIRYVLNKSIEKEIFKNLDFFYNYNLYNDTKTRKIKEKIDEILFKVYETLPTKEYVLPEEIDLLIDWEKIEEKNLINSLSSIKKNKIALLKTNIEYNKFISTQKEYINWKLPEIVKNLDEKQFKIIENEKIKFSDIKMITFSLTSKKIEEPEEILENILKEKDFLFLSKGILRKYNHKNSLILPLKTNNFNRLSQFKFVQNKIFYELTEDISYFDSININYFLLWSNKNKIYFKDFISQSNKSEIDLLFKNIKLWKCEAFNEKNINISHWIEKIKELEIQWRIYKDPKIIYWELFKVKNTEILNIIFENNSNRLLSKDFSLFIFLSSKNIIKTLTYNNITINIKNKIYFQYENIPTFYFDQFVKTFFEYLAEDYDFEYEDMKIIELQSQWFNKSIIKKHEKSSKEKYDFVEEKNNFSKLIKNLS